MHSGATLLTFAVGMLLAQFSPGPDMMLLTATSIRNGWRRTFFMVAGIAAGLLAHLIIIMAGLGPLLKSPAILPWIYLAGGLYLLRLGIPMLRGGGLTVLNPENSAQEPVLSRSAAWRAGLLCNLTNPKAVLFLASFLLGFLSSDDPLWWRPALCGIVVAQALLFWTLYIRALDTVRFRRFFGQHEGRISLLCGAVLILLALSLLRDWFQLVVRPG